MHMWCNVCEIPAFKSKASFHFGLDRRVAWGEHLDFAQEPYCTDDRAVGAFSIEPR